MKDNEVKLNYKKNKRSALALSKDQRRQNNKSENQFKLLLDSAGIIYEWQKPFYNDVKFCVCDFYLSIINTVVEIDGSSHARSKGKDKQRTEFLLNFHSVDKVLRIKNTELKTKGIGFIKELIEFHKEKLR